jgi:HEAT repeat protein
VHAAARGVRSLPPLAQNLLLSLCSAALFAGAAEGIARLGERHRPPPTAGGFITRWGEGEDEFYTVKTTATGWPPWEDYNSEGVRDREHEVAKPAGVRRVACLGDSVTLGTGLPAEEAWPQLLQDRLDARDARVEVLNVALGGWSTRQEHAAYARIARKYRPDLVLLGVCLNDIPELHNNLARPPRLLAALHLRSALVRWAVGAQRREIRQIDELFQASGSPRVRAAFAHFFSEVEALQGDVRRDGAALALVVFPYARQVEAAAPAPTVQDEIAAFGRRRGLPVVDLRPALLELGAAAFADEIHLTARGTARAAEAIAAAGLIGPDAAAEPDVAAGVAALAAALESGARAQRARAAWAIGRHGAGAAPALAALVRALGDGDAGVRAGACWTLGRIGPAAQAAAAGALVDRLADADRDVRRRAADALAHVGAGCAGCVAALAGIASRPEARGRAQAARVLGTLGPGARAAVPALASALGDARPDVRGRAAWALGRIGPDAAPAVPALLALVDDEAAGWQATDALGAIGPRARAAGPRLVRALSDSSSSVRWRAAQALGKLGPAAGDAAAALAAAAGDGEANVRLAAVSALARVEAGPDSALPALRRALSDGDSRVRRSALLGLAHLGPRARAHLVDVIAASHDGDAPVRAAAARALHRLGPSPDARTALQALAGDCDPAVRAAARHALRTPQLAGR